jgi:hypothetical protein
VLVVPFIRPPGGIGDTPPLPYYLYCLVGIAVIVVGVLYWAVWKLVLPYVFGFRLVPRKEVLKDGTVVTLVSSQDAWSSHRLNVAFMLFRSSPEKRWNEDHEAMGYEKSQESSVR